MRRSWIALFLSSDGYLQIYPATVTPIERASGVHVFFEQALF